MLIIELECVIMYVYLCCNYSPDDLLLFFYFYSYFFFFCALRCFFFFFFFQAEDGIRDHCVTGVQTCALPIFGVRLGQDEVGLAARLLLHLGRRALRGHERRAQQRLELAVAHEVRLELLDPVAQVGALAPDVLEAGDDLSEQLVRRRAFVAAESDRRCQVPDLDRRECHLGLLFSTARPESPSAAPPAAKRRAAASSVARIGKLFALPASLHRLLFARRSLAGEFPAAPSGTSRGSR